jgi:hypothetical protein
MTPKNRFPFYLFMCFAVLREQITDFDFLCILNANLFIRYKSKKRESSIAYIIYAIQRRPKRVNADHDQTSPNKVGVVPNSEHTNRLIAVFGSNIKGQHEEIVNGLSGMILGE